jgi:hypothetical protein
MAPVFSAYNVLNLAAKESIFVGNQTIFANVVGT